MGVLKNVVENIRSLFETPKPPKRIILPFGKKIDLILNGQKYVVSET